jgi:hypothetical protein
MELWSGRIRAFVRAAETGALPGAMAHALYNHLSAITIEWLLLTLDDWVDRPRRRITELPHPLRLSLSLESSPRVPGSAASPTPWSPH